MFIETTIDFRSIVHEGFYEITIIDTHFKQNMVPEKAHLNRWVARFCMSAYLLDVYSKRRISPVQNYLKYIQYLEGLKDLVVHLDVLARIYPVLYEKYADCIMRESKSLSCLS